ncbi:MAG: bifunctional methylenetetrahydrofolate dehydrogenase/methenyltetrahydrofolate cyclohydrolase FolD [Pirellulaceae bacterium]|nr:bifunctional methylenetetrahydrofolate dehydrogenase/methenyltetrahydrofolate cyclohydrolase FolD [Pirellulaceae bacterium]MEC8302687.1 bifunctional methylenetetrahydrofolate dehydrogenase/methenyltetrahydrofolate cyclohydrolase FolD [Planctomycetota bacterium]MEC9149179.1 bifunctional methylenetetrahydrofolate dehydrogenase/methenyltetrahydrofolate cyclohydrolase FolD [Planctomycetota bacterium]
MAATLLDGKALAKKIQAELAEQVAVFTEQTQKVPTLATVLVGEDPASQVYIRNKIRSCERVGMESRHIPLPADVSQEALMEEVQQLNRDDTVHGILVQLPLPDGLDAQPILDAILPAKDVDAFHPENVGLLSQGRPRYLPCTPHGVIQLLHRAGIETAGKHCVIVGRSDIVGKPLGLMLVQRQSGCGPTAANATVTICHSRTQNLRDITKQADVLIAAIGQAEFITADMVKPGSVVVDVGINRGENGLVGDVAFEEVSEVAAAITPVPGGVGPLTVTMLLENTLRAAQHQAATQTESA